MMEWKSLLTTFVCILFGFALALFFIEKGGGRPGMGPRHHKHAKGDKGRRLNTFAKEFDLDERQREKAKLIFSEQRKKIKALRKKVFPEFHKIREQTHAEIRKLIPEDKKAAFDKRHIEMKSRRKNVFSDMPRKRGGRDRRGPPGRRGGFDEMGGPNEMGDPPPPPPF